VAIGLRLGDDVAADRAASAAAVVDDDRLPQTFLHPAGQRTADDVRDATGAERHDHAHRPVGEVLR
jgi:hypothetical protein